MNRHYVQTTEDKAKANKLKVNLYIDLLNKGKTITPESKAILRILSKDTEIKKEIHQYLRSRSRRKVYDVRPRKNKSDSFVDK